MPPGLPDVLEWSAFILAAVATLGYGRSVNVGATWGMLSAVTFMAWGFAADLAGAFTINVGFLALHCYNLWRHNCPQS